MRGSCYLTSGPGKSFMLSRSRANYPPVRASDRLLSLCVIFYTR